MKDSSEVAATLRVNYNEISALWERAENELKAFGVPRDVGYCYHKESLPADLIPCILAREGRTVNAQPALSSEAVNVYSYLCWMRIGKFWRIVHEKRIAYRELDDTREDECVWKPITECALALRLGMIQHFPKLRQEVVKTAERVIEETAIAIAEFHKVLKTEPTEASSH